VFEIIPPEGGSEYSAEMPDGEILGDVEGLELEPAALWDMRHRLLGLGGLQIGLTTVAIMGGGILMGRRICQAGMVKHSAPPS